MTLTQVSTWFANARRRLKKENKWSPDAGFEDDEEKGNIYKPLDWVTNVSPSVTNDNLMTIKAEESGYPSHNDGSGSNSGSHPPSSPLASPTRSPPSSSPVSIDEVYQHQLAAHVRLQHDHHFHLPAFHHAPPMVVSAPSSIKSDSIKKESEKPQRKIWSLAEMSSSSNSNMSEDEPSDNEELQVN